MSPEPIDPKGVVLGPQIVIQASYKDSVTGETYVHESMVKTQEPWAEEAHIRPREGFEAMGDVESFVAFVTRYGSKATLLSWSSGGLKAVLDYAVSLEEPGRGKWGAQYKFTRSLQWNAWLQFACGKPMGQREAVEGLEDLALDIVEPAPADLMNLLRSLRATLNTQANAELRQDGTSSIAFTQNREVKSGPDSITIPSGFTISVPVLRGHTDAEDRPVIYQFEVRIRVAVDDSARLMFRFTIPQAERIIEDVYTDRVKHAKGLLGEEYPLLRAEG